MRALTNYLALLGVVAILSVILMDQGFWPDILWHPQIKREVTHIEEGADGDISRICNSSQSFYWSPKTVDEAGNDIAKNGITYYLSCKSDIATVLAYKMNEVWNIRTENNSCRDLKDLPRGCD